jgi:16S rRNA pseudouridine516 synthase
MTLEQFLFSQGHGTRRVCAGLIEHDLVRFYEQNRPSAQYLCASAAIDFIANQSAEALEGLAYQVRDAQGRWIDWVYHASAVILLNKPTGYECSHKPSAWPSVYTLLPAPLRNRPTKGVIQGVQAVGRLDQDTTGALLLTDDGALVHRLSSPKHHVPKVYEVTCKHPVSDEQIRALLAGVVLNDDPDPVRASACERLHESVIAMTLTQGKYHQVKRMLAAVGNRVEALHRSQVGSLTLGGLEPGQWRWLSAHEVTLLYKPSTTAPAGP